MSVKVSRAIQDHIIEEYEEYTVLDEMNEPAAIQKLAKDWLMTPMEIHDILVVWRKQNEDIDFTGNLGEIV